MRPLLVSCFVLVQAARCSNAVLLAAMMRQITMAQIFFHAKARWAKANVAGQGLVEYGLILVMIMVVCVAILTVLGQTLSESWYDRLVTAWPSS